MHTFGSAKSKHSPHCAVAQTFQFVHSWTQTKSLRYKCVQVNMVFTIKGTRIPVSLILGYLTVGHTTEEIIVEFPEIKTTQIYACLDYVCDLSEVEEVA